PQSDRPLRLAIEVEDTGIGFSTDMMRKLFDEFEQGDAAASRQSGGTGLGLAISKKLARAMGGDILAMGTPGAGATFIAILGFELAEAPASEKPGFGSQLPSAASGIGAPAQTTGRRAPKFDFSVLVAEDNRINALLARTVIERAGGRA